MVWSEQVYRIFGYEPGSVEVTAEVFFRHVHSADRRRLEEAIRTAIEKREPYGTEYRIKRADGVERVVHGNAVVEVDGAGRPRRIIGAMQDVTERKRAEESLRTSEEFNRRIVESSSDCIKILDLEGRLLYISPRGQVLLGIENPAAHINGSWIELWPGEGRLAALETLAQSRAGGVGSFQAFGPTPQGQPKWWDTVITPMTDARGQVVRLLAVSRDITESKQSEESLKTALAEVRQLKDRLQEENIYLQEEVQGANNFGEIIGRSEMLRRVLEPGRKSRTDRYYLPNPRRDRHWQGAVRARLHNLSRSAGALVKLNCAAVPPS